VSLALAVLLAASSSAAPKVDVVRRGNLDVRVKVKGTVAAEDVVGIRSEMDGCIEDLYVSSSAWRRSGEILATIVSQQVSDLLAPEADPERRELLKKSYTPTIAYCRDDCFVLNINILPKECIKAKASLFDVSRSLQLVGRVRAEDVLWIRDGMGFSYWPVNAPRDSRRGKIAKLLPSESGDAAAGGLFKLRLSMESSLDPGTEWEGELPSVSVKEDVLKVPTQALLVANGEAYLPVRVSTGISAQDLTQITAGASEADSLLAPAGAPPLRVRRGDLDIRVKITGTVVPNDIFRIKSSIEGRVEKAQTSTGTWRSGRDVLASLAPKELTALLDSRGAQDSRLLEDRWQTVYKETPVGCAGECYILRSYVKPKTWVKAQSVLYEAAARLDLVGRVRPEDMPLVRDGMEFSFWPTSDPKDIHRGRITRLVLDIQGQKLSPGASFVLKLSPERYFPPGTEWEGELIAVSKKNILLTPTKSLIRLPTGEAYLPIRVSTGPTIQSVTQVASGVVEKTEFLILDDEQLATTGAERCRPQIDVGAVERRLKINAPTAPAAPAPSPKDPRPKAEPPKERDPNQDVKPQPEKDENEAEDPYGDI